ncbi:hypothetical protein [Agrococcus sp. SGAir0287]|uniref:hypothetical protein n=1 Tax=Agrococcus sp. SGAir0287 TaxID=2070347 RepID=UPI0010CD67C2|nr:hypothetical protein [Agrococcus sp. SGAir0287]QCR20410.1 hypothetical protein C1N71_13960 [Agrococcus sp. SGAir0287]
MDIVERAQDLMNLGVVVYAAIALMLLGMLALLCVGVAVVERRGTARERRRSTRAALAGASYGAPRARLALSRRRGCDTPGRRAA